MKQVYNLIISLMKGFAAEESQISSVVIDFTFHQKYQAQLG